MIRKSGFLRESDVKRRVFALLRTCRCAVYSLSQSRASHQTPGLPDVYVFPGRGKPPFWWEAKAARGRGRPVQLKFKYLCEDSGVRCIVGGEAEVRAHLRALGIL